ncbi:MAG: helix-turn-helix transcriptional regulator [Pseudomonadota bacterium]
MLDGFYRNAGRLARHKRLDRGLSGRKLAKDLKMCRNMISKIEDGHHFERTDQTTQTVKLLRHLGVPASGIGDLLFASMAGCDYPYMLVDMQDDDKRIKEIEDAIRRGLVLY